MPGMWDLGTGATWTFNPALATNRDQVRSRVGDFDTNNRLIANETIDTILTEESNDVKRAAARVCERIAARADQETDVTADQGRVRALGQLRQNFKDRARELWAAARSTPVGDDTVDGGQVRNRINAPVVRI